MTDYQIAPGASTQADRQTRNRAHEHGQAQDQLSEEYTIETPENVSFGYEVSGIGSRFIGALIDTFILTMLLVGLNVAVLVLLASLGSDPAAVEESLEGSAADWAAGVVIAIYALLNFAIWWGYYLLFEWLWNGQTLGKRIAKIRVVRTDGAPVGFLPVAVRNLVRVIDFLPMGYGVGVVTMFCNRQSRRLGDFAGGTLVVMDQGALTLESLMAPPSTPKSPAVTPTTAPAVPPVTPAIEAEPELTPDQDWSTIRRLTPADFELVQETLARYRAGKLNASLLARVSGAIATKLERAPSSPLDGTIRTTPADHVAFLTAVATAYGRWVR